MNIEQPRCQTQRQTLGVDCKHLQVRLFRIQQVPIRGLKMMEFTSYVGGRAAQTSGSTKRLVLFLSSQS